MRSAASSGSAFSSVAVTVSIMEAIGSLRASLISSLVMTIFLGSPEMVSRPATLHCQFPFREGRQNRFGFWLFLPLLHRSGGCRFFLRWLITASSISSPPVLIDSQVAMSANDMMATSVVPPPISTIIDAVGSVIGSPAPMPAAIGSSTRKTFLAPARSALSMTARRSTAVIPLGTAMDDTWVWLAFHLGRVPF